jgi:hypothetical protein
VTPGLAVLVGIVLVPVGIVQILAPRASWSVFAPLMYRTPARVEPSERQYRHARLTGIVVATAGAGVVALGAPWEPWVVFRVTASIAGAGAVAIVVTAAVMAWRNSRDDRDLPPDEPSEARYLSWSFGTGVAAVIFAGFCVWGWQYQSPAQERAAWVAEHRDTWTPTLTADVLTTTDTIPDGNPVMFAGRYVEVDAEARTPEILWAVAEELGNDAVERLRRADLAIHLPRAAECPVTAVVLRENPVLDDRYDLGVVVPRGAMSNPEGYDPCGESGDTTPRWMLVELDRPLSGTPTSTPDVGGASAGHWAPGSASFKRPPP